MLELKNVSKFYHSKGIITTGISKVNLKFNLGEFIAITGESGSGKSTLLNVISGLDSYEEGEMYINGEETSHYTEKDYELYRKKYVSNIFQNFNLVNSYTVYQNIELILLLKGKTKKEVKEEVLFLIKKVDLYKYRNRKVSKLSGGQKQRVAIARALACDTPIILADEPTGNLDSKSSESVLKLLHEISSSKLVIVVTHNYDQIEKYVTRKITMHDGKVLEDKKIKDYEKQQNYEIIETSKVKLSTKIRLGFRNAFNIFSKCILILAVYLFIVFSVFFVYGSFAKTNYMLSNEGFNTFFLDLSDTRIIIKNEDYKSFTDDSYEQIKNIDNVDKIIKQDALVDRNISISSNNYYFYGYVLEYTSDLEVSYGRLPLNDNEIVIRGNKNSNYYLQSTDPSKIIDSTYSLEDLYDYVISKEFPVKIVGIIYDDEVSYDDTYIYVSEYIYEKLNNQVIKENSTIKYLFAGSEIDKDFGNIIKTSKVPKGKVVIGEEYEYKCKNYNCKNYSFVLKINNIYENYEKKLVVLNTYNKDNMKSLVGYSYDDYNGFIFMNDKDYDELFSNKYYQSSVYVKDPLKVNETIKSLNDLGYKALYVKDTMTDSNNTITRIMNIIRTIVIIALIVVLFFISYFIIKLILKSRNTYFSTLRILGASKNNVKSILNYELFTLSHLAFLIFITFILLIKNNVIVSKQILELTRYISFYNYLFIYIVLVVITLLIVSRYTRKLFKDSCLNTYKEEV